MNDHHPIRARLPRRPRIDAPADHGPGFRQVIDGRRGVISAHGALDRGTAEQVRGSVHALRYAGHRQVVLHLHGLRSADQAALRTLLSLRSALTADGGDLVLLGLPDEVVGEMPR